MYVLTNISKDAVEFTVNDIDYSIPVGGFINIWMDSGFYDREFSKLSVCSSLRLSDDSDFNHIDEVPRFRLGEMKNIIGRMGRERKIKRVKSLLGRIDKKLHKKEKGK